MTFALRVIVIVSVLSGVPVLQGQATTVVVAPQSCKAADIDATFYFADAPAGHQVIAINLHNTSAADCRLRGELAPSFAVDGHVALPKTCWFCTNGEYDREAIKRNDNFVLAREATAHVKYRWSSTGDDCQRIDWVTFDANWDGRTSYERRLSHDRWTSYLFDAKRWKPHVCSEIAISGYEDGLAPGSGIVAGTTLEARLPSTPLYGDERAALTVTLKSPSHSVMPAEGCPELYAVYDAKPETRFEPLYPDDYNSIVPTAPGQPVGHTRTCEAKGGQSETVVTLPGSTLAPSHVFPFMNLEDVHHILWRAVDAKTHEPVFVSMTPHFNILNPATLPQNWGPRVKGIGVGLSIDKGRYQLGEAIPLHIHWENFSADETLGVTECGGPGLQVEMQDAYHRVLQTVGTGFELECSGHYRGPSVIQSGAQRNDFLSFKPDAALFDGTQFPISAFGTYYFVAVWSPRMLVKRAQSNSPLYHSDLTVGEIYATVRSEPVRVEIR